MIWWGQGIAESLPPGTGKSSCCPLSFPWCPREASFLQTVDSRKGATFLLLLRDVSYSAVRWMKSHCYHPGEECQVSLPKYQPWRKPQPSLMKVKELTSSTLAFFSYERWDTIFLWWGLVKIDFCEKFSGKLGQEFIVLLTKGKNTILFELFGLYSLVLPDCKLLNLPIKKYRKQNRKSRELTWYHSLGFLIIVLYT